MKRHILIPLDGSPLAETILPHAARMARLTSSDIVLLRAVPPAILVEPVGAVVVPASTLQNAWDENMTLAGKYLDEVAARLREEGFAVDTRVVEDDPADAIISYAEEDTGVTMIAMATHGRSGLRRWVFGSVAERVLHYSPRPLLLVHPQNHPPPSLKIEDVVYHNILVPLDGSDFAEQALGWAQAVAAYDATLMLVAVVPDPTTLKIAEYPGARWVGDDTHSGADRIAEYLEARVLRLGASGVLAHPYIRQGRPADMILQAAGDVQADLIVMSTHGRTGLERLWLGSVAARVVQGATLPVLLVRPKVAVRERAGVPNQGVGAR